MGVATDIVVRLEYRDVVLTREQIGAGQSGDAAANNCDALLCVIVIALLEQPGYNGRGCQMDGSRLRH